MGSAWGVRFDRRLVFPSTPSIWRVRSNGLARGFGVPVMRAVVLPSLSCLLIQGVCLAALSGLERWLESRPALMKPLQAGSGKALRDA